MDESHYIKNRGTQRAKVLLPILKVRVRVRVSVRARVGVRVRVRVRLH